jgi:quinol-cytochrome oxidoreductase complex cytochrome b subunit
MKDIEKEMLDNHDALIKKVLKSLFYTFLIFVFSIWGIGFLIHLPYQDMSVEQANTLYILSICIGIIFTIFYCTFTIVEEIKKKK